MVPVENIKVGQRHRRDLGDIAELAASIAKIGLIHPIAVTEDMLLVAGERRLAAVRSLGWTEVPVTVVTGLTEASDMLVAERDENTCRKEMTVSELMSLAAALEELERPRAAARKAQASGRPQGQKVSPVHLDGREVGETREVVAKAVGMSGGTYNRARAVYRAATDPTVPAEEQAVARDALAQIDAGEIAISTGYTQVREHRAKQQPRGNTMIRAAEQRRAITAGTTTLSGIAMGFAQITELHPDITSEEAAQWVGDLLESRQAINGLIKQLRERTNAEV